ncbi:MAG: threonine ammonia-lyase [Candidatus Njordarchaeota archaeon]
MGSLIDEIYNHIKKAKKVLEGVVHKTPLDKSETFSKMTKAKCIYLKLENLQKTGSFKPRGAYYKISSLSQEEKSRGVVAISSGNHAQGVAYAASIQGVSAKIIMPIFAPISKILATKAYGAEVVLYGETFDQAAEKVKEIIEKEKRTLIHPYDDKFIIAGQGTIGLEILENLKKPDIVVVPVGGGGLISGIAIAIKKKLGDKVKIIGVQSEAYPGVMAKLGLIKLPEKKIHTIADGIAIKKPGELTTKIISELVDDMITVSDDEIAYAIFMLLERAKTLVEGAGAVGLAAVLSGKIDVENKDVAVVISGGNMDITRLIKILNRELVALKRLVKLDVTMPDIPGALSRLLDSIAKTRINVVDITIEKYSPYIKPQEVIAEIIVEVPVLETLNELIKEAEKLGYRMEISEI